VLAVGLTAAGIGKAHAARNAVSPNKACSNGTSCFSIVQNGPGEGIVSHSQLGNAVESHSLNGNALYGATQNPSGTTKQCASGVVGLDLSTDGGTLNFGVSGRSYHGSGVLGLSGSGNGLLGSSTRGTGVMAASGSSDHPALAMHATGSGLLASAQNATSQEVMTLDQGGNLTIAGQLTTGGTCKQGCNVGRGGVRVVSYAPRQSSPTMEDFGEAQLIGGATFVRLDPSFANAIDATKEYLVFITPYGETKGLYVSTRLPNGFEVREAGGGKSNAQFGYRIVAKPFGSAAQRLPMVRSSGM
jgi:hypothetical protein